VTYTYDGATGLLTRVEDGLTGAQVNFTYDNDFRLTGITRSNNVNTTLTWDNASRLTRVQDLRFKKVLISGNGSSPLLSFDSSSSIVFDSCRIARRTDDDKIVVHEINSLCPKPFLHKFFFEGFCVDQHEIHIPLTSYIQGRACPRAYMADADACLFLKIIFQ
jgi:YD repeat-containing protein